MDLRRLTDTIFVAPQIDIADLPRLSRNTSEMVTRLLAAGG